MDRSDVKYISEHLIGFFSAASIGAWLAYLVLSGELHSLFKDLFKAQNLGSMLAAAWPVVIKVIFIPALLSLACSILLMLSNLRANFSISNISVSTGNFWPFTRLRKVLLGYRKQVLLGGINLALVLVFTSFSTWYVYVRALGWLERSDVSVLLNGLLHDFAILGLVSSAVLILLSVIVWRRRSQQLAKQNEAKELI